MSIDLINNEFYNAYADSFDKIPFEDVFIPLLLKYLPFRSSDILEIGSGAGALALWLSKMGHKVTCIEPAERPAKKAKEKGLKVYLERFQDFSTSQKFDSLIAISSLIHIPRLEMTLQAQKLLHLIKPSGIIFISFLEGESEGFEDPTGCGKGRFFSKFTEAELNNLLSPYFSIVENHKIKVKRMKQSFFLMALKPLSHQFNDFSGC